MELHKAIKTRCSVHKFKNKKPNWRGIIECIDSCRYAPMAGNNFTLKFVIVSDLKTIEKISDAAQQPFISKAQYVVVVCSDPTRTLNSYEKRGEIYLRQQAGAAIQNFLLKINDMGMATCWVGHFVDEMIKEELKIPGKIQIEAVLPIGYPLDKAQARKAKIDMDNILYFEKYGNKKMQEIKKIDV